MISQSQAFNESALSGRLTYLDSGASNARIRIYGGTRPSSGAAPGTPLLAEITLTKPAGVVAGNVLTLDSGLLTLVQNSGTATWARIVNGNGDFAFDCDAGISGSGAEIILSDVALFAGGKVALVSAVLG